MADPNQLRLLAANQLLPPTPSPVPLAFLLLHTFGTYVSFTGFDMHAGSVGGRDQLLCKAWTPALHLAMALTTLLNLVDGGCRATVWLLLLGAAATLALAGQISFGFGPG